MKPGVRGRHCRVNFAHTPPRLMPSDAPKVFVRRHPGLSE